MHRYNKLFLFIAFVFNISKAHAQETLPHTTYQNVNAIASYGRDNGFKMFELKDGNSLFVQYCTGVCLFDPNGKLIRENSNIVETMSDSDRLAVCEMGNKIVLLTQSVDGNEIVAHLWDISSADTALKLNDVRFIRPKMTQGYPISYAYSHEGNKILLVGPCREKLVVLNQDIQVESEIEFIQDAKQGSETQSFLDNLAIDEDGNILISVFFQEGVPRLRRVAGSWNILAISNNNKGFQAWDLAQLFKIEKFTPNVSYIRSIGNGQFVFSFCNYYDHPGILNLAAFDVMDEDVIAKHSIDVAEPASNTKRNLPVVPISIERVNQNTFAFAYTQGSTYIGNAGQRGSALIDILEGKLISSGDMFPPTLWGYRNPSVSDGNLTMFAGYASPKVFEYMRTKTPINGTTYNNNLKTKDFLPYLVIHDLKENATSYNICYHNPNVKLDNKNLFFTNNGTLVIAEQHKKEIILHLHK